MCGEAYETRGELIYHDTVAQTRHAIDFDKKNNLIGRLTDPAPIPLSQHNKQRNSLVVPWFQPLCVPS